MCRPLLAIAVAMASATVAALSGVGLATIVIGVRPAPTIPVVVNSNVTLEVALSFSVNRSLAANALPGDARIRPVAGSEITVLQLELQEPQARVPPSQTSRPAWTRPSPQN